jgi:hypothetical protein
MRSERRRHDVLVHRVIKSLMAPARNQFYFLFRVYIPISARSRYLFKLLYCSTRRFSLFIYLRARIEATGCLAQVKMQRFMKIIDANRRARAEVEL